MLAISSLQAEEAVLSFSEQEFLAEIPSVYSSSRLPQHPRDAAGALSVIDREFIRASGARSIAELFRLVPGFQVGVSSGGRPVVAYHGLSGQMSQRMQVYVDGRSLYAPYLFGGVDWSVISVPLDEIERIEIQRGANSVTYGANAFLSVIHIITRAAAQSVGFRAQVTQGENGISDRHFRWGQGIDDFHWRVAAGSRADGGLAGRADTYRTDYVDFRSEKQLSAGQELSIFGGGTRSQLGIGYPGRDADPARTEEASSAYLQIRHRHVVDAGNEWQLAASVTNDEGKDDYSIPLLDGRRIPIDGERRSRRVALEYQHFKEFTSQFRGAWGIEYRSESLESRQYFNTDQAQQNAAWRSYIGSEWRPSPEWTLNIGGLVERDRLAPLQFADRIALNWKPGEVHTFKFGYSSAFRMPSLFEQRADWRIIGDGKVIDLRYLSSGGLLPEQIHTLDFVYSASWERLGLTLDTRVFREEMKRLITGQLTKVPSEAGFTDRLVAYDLRNNASARNVGFEYEAKWHPRPGTLLMWSQYWANPDLETTSPLARAIPEQSSSILVSHALSNGWRASGSYTRISPMRWLGEATMGGVQRLVTLSVGREFPLWGGRTEINATLSHPLGITDEFRELQRNPEQAWISLIVEY